MDSYITDMNRHYEDLLHGVDPKNIDFFGINITDLESKEPIYKIYHSGISGKNEEHPLVKFIFQKGMLRYFEDVKDSERPESLRIDISLSQRNDANMNDLFAYLLQTVPFFASHASRVKLVSGMKITDLPGYHSASLYHVGLIEKNEIPELLKFHFFTRWCEDPNHHSKDGYRDTEYLEYLRSINIKEYGILAKRAAFILEHCGGHLWMVGMDLSSDKVKYKIYLKNIRDAYKYLPCILGESAVKRLQDVEAWNEEHKECRMAGIAIALDSCAVSSVNLYYHVG